ncbi:class I SAM-dependent methyltransferase [Methanosphaerula palustris]|uniref:O-methyltransferase domain protein n=1 Tax=Methanosphaerula palustris (strain ATCC BAA-1556 / DSM 19958 / E1-9c) TaxID=521011 RepID=B8GH45_METPE|nr:class I SAM-dependent methyltransferase [Methanosphaerula palustris]ACL16450.1 O-methyltransferase domain protein [Methanosphaerula palustris E1-9c]
METEKIQLKKENETYLITLYGKALDSRTKNPILNDTFADAVIRKIDFDFEKLKTPKGAEVSLPVRAKHFDGWTREFLAAHPDSIVLNLGCGLDSRVFRIDPPAGIRWYDVDLPDVIELRRHLYPECHDCFLIGSSVTDPGWLDSIPGDRPVIVVAEGLLQYLTEQDVIALFSRITGKFPKGQIIFDAYSLNMIRFVMLLAAARRSRPSLLWGMGDPRKLETAVPRLRLVTEISFLTMPELVERLSPSRARRAMSRLMGPFVKKMVRHFRYEF